jgi:hypothetical protein
VKPLLEIVSSIPLQLHSHAVEEAFNARREYEPPFDHSFWERNRNKVLIVAEDTQILYGGDILPSLKETHPQNNRQTIRTQVRIGRVVPSTTRESDAPHALVVNSPWLAEEHLLLNYHKGWVASFYPSRRCQDGRVWPAGRLSRFRIEGSITYSVKDGVEELMIGERGRLELGILRDASKTYAPCKLAFTVRNS